MVGTLSFTFPFFRHMLCNKKFYHHTLFHVNWWHVSRFFFFFTSENPSRKKVGSVAKVAWKSSDKNMCQLVFLIVKLKKKRRHNFSAHLFLLSLSFILSLSPPHTHHPLWSHSHKCVSVCIYACMYLWCEYMYSCIYKWKIKVHVLLKSKLV